MGNNNEREKGNQRILEVQKERQRIAELNANSLVLTIMLVGDSHVGKTTILKNYIKPRELTGETPESISLKGSQLPDDGRSVRLVIYDTLTAESANSVLTTGNWRVVSNPVERSAIILVFDLAKSSSIDGGTGIYSYLEQMGKQVERGVSVYLVANKTDLNRVVSTEQINNLIQKLTDSHNANNLIFLNAEKEPNVIYLQGDNEQAVKNDLFNKIIKDLIKANPIKKGA